jgi:diguanylate cyclase (GGDEF)-like protein/PAS domain S-box-containing protein
MGRFPLKAPSENTPPRLKSTGLPAKVTGIVFWGLVIIGLILTVITNSYIKDALLFERELSVTAAVGSIDELMESHAGEPLDSYHTEIDEWRKRFGFDALVITLTDESVSLGNISSEQEETKNTFYTRIPVNDETADLLRSGSITIYQTPIDAVIADYRKKILIGMVGLFLLFGMLLQFILKRIISMPFMHMVNTAQDIVKGGEELRFDTDRQDEFGFLGKFINQALDHMADQQLRLEGALKKQSAVEKELEKEKELAETTLYSITDAVITIDRNGNIEFLNPAGERMTGWSIEHARFKDIDKILDLRKSKQDKRIDLPIRLTTGKDPSLDTVKGTGILTSRDGMYKNVEYSVAPTLDQAGRVQGSVIVLQDLTESQELAQQLVYQATHDGLTGLINRNEFDNRIQSLIDKTKKSGTGTHALLYMDLDQFKMVNDSCGHIAGDEMLRQLSERIREHIGETETLARLGGDEFGVLLEDSTVHRAEFVANRLREEVEDFRFNWNDKSFGLGVSIGLVPIDINTDSKDDLLSMADRACYAAKDAGRNRVRVFQPNDLDMLRRFKDTEWVTRIHKAIDDDTLLIATQPIVPVDPQHKMGEMFEVLLRMQGTDGKIIHAGAFLPAAERFNMMHELDRWVMKAALKWLSDDHDQLNRLDTCMLNLSGQTLTDEHFAGFAIEAINRHRVPGNKICFEITETAAIANLTKARTLIKELKAVGCRFALDDFGSGMSSYAYLKTLPVDFIKIDGIFVKDILTDPVDTAMVRSINEIGHIMGKKTIAEYVENDAIMQKLHDLGVDYGQGFGIAKPEVISGTRPPTEYSINKLPPELSA